MPKGRLLSRIRETDWDFAGNPSESPFSAIHWHPGRFASQLPAALIGLLSEPGDLILDPFVGSGTTLVEAQRLGRHSIGIDLNPIACLTARAKTLTVPAERIERYAFELERDATTHLASSLPLADSRELTVGIPSTVQAKKWYTSQVRRQLEVLWRLTRSYSGPRRLLSEVAFSSLLLPVSRETRHWGYVCDNSTPRGNHEGDVLACYGATLSRLVGAYHERDADLHARFGNPPPIRAAEVKCGDVGNVVKAITPKSVDLIITSPPYFGVCDYAKAQRLSMEWFGLEIEPLRLKEIGARSKRHRQKSTDEYVNELGQTFEALHRCLRAEGHCVVILGESKARDSIMGKLRPLFGEAGFQVELELNRRVSSQRRQAPSVTNEHIFLLSC